MRTRTVEQGFKNFLQILKPTSKESDAAKKHRASIEACLKSKLGITRFVRTGSFGRSGTSISGYSDVDYFAQIPTSNLEENSTLMLRRVRDVLDQRFPRTGVRVNRPAVIVPFRPDAKERTEITPAGYVEVTTKDEYKVYDIPDFSGGWVRSSSLSTFKLWVDSFVVVRFIERLRSETGNELPYYERGTSNFRLDRLLVFFQL